MGGANSEVTNETTNVLIESAYFDPSTIRRIAKALNLQTDSSYRFERGVDRDGQVWAAARAAALIADLGDGTIVPGMVDAHPTPPERRAVDLRPSRLNALLGTKIPVDKAGRLLEQIGFSVEQGDDVLHCTVPTFRPDVELEVDLIEEIARLHGYDRIPEPKQVPVPSRLPRELRTDRLRQRARDVLRGLGLRETRTNSMLPAERAAQFNQRAVAPTHSGESLPVVETLNPISQEMATLRPTLIPGVLEVMQHNTNHGQEALRFFEFGHVFHRSGPNADTIVPGFQERETVLIALSGPAAPTHWDRPARAVDFFDLKGAVRTLLDALRIDDATFEPASTDDPLATYQLDVHTHDKTPLGTLLRVADPTAAAFDLEDPAFIAELDWAVLVERAVLHEERHYTPISRFPIVERDLAVLIDGDQPVGPLLDTLRAEGRPLLQDVRVFDIYTGEGIPNGQKSVAVGLRFGGDRTLKDQEVDALVQAMLDALNEQHGATLRQ
jgi:phenylalanyl-tRNA synthetase beta chain